MKLKSLKISNFRRFYGLQSMDFSTDVEKKFTIIHAENGTGKTNLLRAVHWCLFDTIIDLDEGEEKNPTNNIHKVEVSNKERELDCFVTLEILKENGDIYRFRRKQISLSANAVTAKINGMEKDQQETRMMIEEILPSALSKYFLFHGEGLKTLTKKSTDINKAVEDIQGIGDAMEVLAQIESSSRKLNTTIESSNKANKLLADILVRKKAIEKEIDKTYEEKKVAEKDEKESLKTWEDLIAKQGKTDSIMRKKASKERARDEKELERKRIAFKNHELTKKTNIISHYAGVMGYESALICYEIKKELELEGKLPEKLTKMLVEEILENEKCICNRCVEPLSEPWKAIKRWEKIVGDPSLTMRLIDLSSKNNEGVKNTDAFISALKDHASTANVYESDIKFLKDNIASNTVILGGGDDTSNEERNLEIDIQTAKEIKDKAKDRHDEKQFHLIQKRRDLDPIDKAYNKLLDESKIDPILKKQKEFLDVASLRLERTIEDQKRTAKEKIKEDLVQMIDIYANKNYKVVFNKEFIPKLNEKVRDIWVPVPPSTGERLLLNLCFISCLVDASVRKLEDKQKPKFVIQGINPPLLIDAPFGDAASYSEQITDVINNISSEQVIILLAKEYYEGGSFKKKIDKSTGKRFILESYMTEKDHKETQTKHGSYQANTFISFGKKKYQQLFAVPEDGFTNIKEIPIDG